MAVRDVAPPRSSGHKSEAAASSGRVPIMAASLAEKYRSLFVLGRGGMGAVEAALELRPGEPGQERVVALKRILPDAARDARRVQMFLREAKVAGMLDHPNVVRAFDYGELDGELYLAMEYVEGQSLSAALRSGGDALDPPLAAYVLAEVCEGLHAAHELLDEEGKPLGLVHRDVSPQNVMLGYDGRVRLLDFGVAKIAAESVTKTGEVKGKTAYMSPEQAMGDPLDRRSDLFGVGALLFECLTGRRMWGDGTDMDVIRKLALEEPPDLPDGAPDALRALYKRLVAREASARPEAAREVAEALRAACPEGREAAAQRLSVLLTTRFGAQADAQREKLARALEHVAPERAEMLRRSVAPMRSEPPRRVERVGARRLARLVVAMMVVAVGPFVVLRVARHQEVGHEVGAGREPAPPAPIAKVADTARPSPPPQPRAAEGASSSSPPDTGDKAALVVKPTIPTASEPVPRTSLPMPIKAPVTSGSAKAATSAPPATARKPLEIDDHPF